MDTQNTKIKQSAKVLPMSYPPITSYTHHANRFSMIINYPKTFLWIYSNYIQLSISRDYGEKDSCNIADFLLLSKDPNYNTFDTCPFYSSQKICRDFINEKYSSIIDFIIEYIDIHHYIYMPVNTFFIPLYDNYKVSHVYHPIFIYGYDTEEKVLHVADFFKGYIYAYEKVSFVDFIKSYQIQDQITFPDYIGNNLFLYKILNESNCEFDIDTVTGNIQEYMQAGSSIYEHAYFKEKISYGIEYYDILNNIINSAVGREFDYFYPDIRPFHVLYDHKKMMLLRIKYLGEQNYLSNADSIYDSYKYIESQTLMLRNIILKSKMMKTNDLIKNAINKPFEIKEKEVEVLQKLLDSVKPSTQ